MYLTTDVDECSSNSHSCDVNAVCSNNHGSHTCTCKAGYTGDGKSCNGMLFSFFCFLFVCWFDLLKVLMFCCVFCFQLNNHLKLIKKRHKV